MAPATGKVNSMLTINRPKRMPKLFWAGVGALLLALCFAVPVFAAQPDGPLPFPEGVRTRPVQNSRQILSDDLTVEEGQVIDDDVFVYSGNVDVESEGRITGDLIVFSGNIEMEEGSVVEGDVINYSGNVVVAGHISGDLAVWSGNVELDSTASVDGDISVASGEIDREEGASVSGNIIEGPSLRFPGRFRPEMPTVPGLPREPGISFSPEPPSFFGRLMNFIGRLFIAALMTGLAMLLVGGLFYVKPQLITDTRKVLREQLALSAVVGALANLVVLFLAGLLAATICLLPLAIVPMLILLGVNILGWAVASQIVGERIVKVSTKPIQPSLVILVGALFLTGICALLWAFGGCFRFIAFLLIFAVSSLGAGAVLVPWINRRPGSGGSAANGGNGGGNVPPDSPIPSGPEPSGAEPVEREVAAPLDYVTAEEINESATQTPEAPKSRARSAGKAATPQATTEQTGESSEEAVVEQDVAAPLDYVTAQEVITTETITEGDDFLKIKGIGPTYARRLKDAGYNTYAQIAAASPDEIAAAVGWPVDRVRRSEVIDQAKVLAQGT
jgi:predicted flap endonuclease-1-like 5' DNA nuclease/cytoskeletal protein CcmA (bactofilin family)